MERQLLLLLWWVEFQGGGRVDICDLQRPLRLRVLHGESSRTIFAKCRLLGKRV